MVNNDGPLIPARGIAHAAAVPIALQDDLSEPTEVVLILPLQRVAGGAEALCKDGLVPAAAVHGSLKQLRHVSAP